MKKRLRNLAFALAIFSIIIPGFMGKPTRAAGIYHVMLTANNFSLPTLSASAIDLSNPAHAVFSLQNGTPLWYSISIQSTPAGLSPIPADNSDLVTSTFFGSTPLLPPANALPLDTLNGGMRYQSLRLALAFTGPGEQAQLTLTPFDTHATLMDVITLLLHVLGENQPGAQIGLLAPGGLKSVFDNASNMSYLQSLSNDYLSLLQTASSDPKNLWQPAYSFASDLVALVNDVNEQQLLVDLLWRILGKTISPESILRTLTSFTSAQIGLGMEGYIKDETLAIGGLLFSQNAPTVLLQSVSDTPTPIPTASPTTPSATITPTITTPNPTVEPTTVKPTPHP